MGNILLPSRWEASTPFLCGSADPSFHGRQQFIRTFLNRDISQLRVSWEGLALEQVLRALNMTSAEAFSWDTHAGAELDLLVLRGGKWFGFEFKFGDTPRTTKSLRVALHDLQLARLFVIYPGGKVYALDERIEAVQLAHVEQLSRLTFDLHGMTCSATHGR